jgi:ribosomal protein S18 acetylase RimI-like enzyme
MPEIKIRPAISTDINSLILFDHDVATDYVWQMDRALDEEQVQIVFRQVRLPRSTIIKYPRQPAELKETWNKKDLLLTASIKERLVGYLALVILSHTLVAWVTDVVVEHQFRRGGIASGLLLAGREWLRRTTKTKKMVLETLPKNHPAIMLAQKTGFEFCGYNDHYYSSQDIALFFGASLTR